MEIADLIQDISPFADDEEDVAVDPDGTIMFARGGDEVACRLVISGSGDTLVDTEQGMLTYRRFITHYLGRLDLFAQRIIEKRPRPPFFIDGDANLHSAAEPLLTGKAMSLIQDQCVNPNPFAARVVFLTADAGHGKTVLLQEHQAVQAKAFLSGEAHYVFWHIDLQGRQLLRLSEAMMGDLGDMRVAGLWWQGVIRLIRHRALVVAIDGFDELAAEQGGTDAVGALANLVDQLGGKGTIVAASRRTFFDTEDYLKRANMFGRAIASPSEFNQISLLPWSSEEGVAYLAAVEVDGERFEDPASAYVDIATELGGSDQHPIVARPFLLAQMARALLRYRLSAADFLRGIDEPLKGVAAVVEAFVSREVQEKWRFRETGEPYLSTEQHMQLLADVAEEMFRSGTDRLPIDVVEALAVLLLEAWGVDVSRRHQILEMVRKHVLLVVPPDGDASVRSFDHPEFRDYFMAVALRGRLQAIARGEDTQELGRFLSIAQVSDATARYACGMLDLEASAAVNVVRGLEQVVRDEWKPTFVHTNVGTILPFVLDGQLFDQAVTFDASAICSSIVFADTELHSVVLRHVTFVNAVFERVSWNGVVLEECDLGDVTIDTACDWSQVHIVRSSVGSIRLVHEGEEVAREFAPERIRWRLQELGFVTDRGDAVGPQEPEDESELHQQVHRFLRVFNRTTALSEALIQRRYGQDARYMLDVVVPLLEEHGVLEPRPWHGAGVQRAWAITVRLQDVLAAEGDVGPAPLRKLWRAVHAA